MFDANLNVRGAFSQMRSTCDLDFLSRSLSCTKNSISPSRYVHPLIGSTSSPFPSRVAVVLSVVSAPVRHNGRTD